MGERSARLAFGPFAVALLLDQATKAWAREALPVSGRSFAFILHFSRIENPGLAFGLLSDSPYRMPILSLTGWVAVCALLWWTRRLPEGTRGAAVGLSLLLAGSGGNLLDRLLYRSVTDFIRLARPGANSVPFGPPFNVADVVIAVGAVLFAVASARRLLADGQPRGLPP
jgi:signal peptidase II